MAPSNLWYGNELVGYGTTKYSTCTVRYLVIGAQQTSSVEAYLLLPYPHHYHPRRHTPSQNDVDIIEVLYD